MDDSEPVHLQEDGETGDRFLIYGEGGGVRVEVQYQGDSLWMTQAQIAALFGRDKSVISRHVNNIFDEGELESEGNMQKMHLSTGRATTLYSLDIVISVGYRASSKQATLFRRWATDKLVRFASKGFVVDANKLKSAGGNDHLAELRDIVRDIRADESNVYRELRRICAMCQDYDPASTTSRDFYIQTQAKLVWAVTSQTPSEIVFSRSDAKSKNMGLTNWKNENIRKTDVAVAKAYLGEAEIRELNRLTVILLDIFEDQLELGKLTLMAEAATLLDKQLTGLNRQVLTHGGRISNDAAKRKAEKEYAKFKADLTAKRHKQADDAIAAITAQVKALPKTTVTRKAAAK